MKSKNYPNLYAKAGQSCWIFSKYSAARGGEFRISTGYEAIDVNAGVAYKEGLARFNDWLGSAALQVGRDPLVRDIAKIILDAKKAKSPNTEIKVRSELKNHILPAFGHLRPNQVTTLRLQQYENEERAIGRRSLFNTRKCLFEILRMARDEGLIRTLPRWKPADPEPEAPRFIDAATFRQIRRKVLGPEKMVLTILYYQGARPTEVCQYRWEMLNWARGEISIPGAITKTRRSRTVPLNSRVHRMLRPWSKPQGPLFPRHGAPHESRVVYDRGWMEAMVDLKLDFKIYNLRDSFCSRKIAEGSSPFYVAQYVDSSVREIERRYAVLMQEILQKVAG